MKIGRNDPCHCGSGQKYKKCHLAQDDAAKSAELAALAAQAAQAAAEAGDEAEEAPAGGKAAPGAPRGHDVGAARPKTSAGPQPPPIRRRAV
jgi:hypothetical protein